MAIVQERYLFFESSTIIGGKDFYTFRLMLMDDTLRTLYYLLGDDAPEPLQLIDIPVLVPSTINEGETFSRYGASGTWSAPEDMYFVYAKGAPFSEGIYPTAPGEENVSISTSFWNRPQIVYCESPGDEISTWPNGDDPSEKELDENGWLFPAYEGFGYVETGVASRYLNPFYYTAVQADLLWVWFNCSDYIEDEDHVLNNIATATLINQTHFITVDPNYIYHCDEGTGGSGYWIEREVLSVVEHLNIWLFQADENAYYYPVVPIAQPGVAPVGVFVALLAIAALLPGLVSNRISFIKKLPRLYAKPQYYALQTDGLLLSADGRGLVTN